MKTWTKYMLVSGISAVVGIGTSFGFNHYYQEKYFYKNYVSEVNGVNANTTIEATENTTVATNENEAANSTAVANNHTTTNSTTDANNNTTVNSTADTNNNTTANANTNTTTNSTADTNNSTTANTNTNTTTNSTTSTNQGMTNNSAASANYNTKNHSTASTNNNTTTSTNTSTTNHSTASASTNNNTATTSTNYGARIDVDGKVIKLTQDYIVVSVPFQGEKTFIINQNTKMNSYYQTLKVGSLVDIEARGNVAYEIEAENTIDSHGTIVSITDSVVTISYNGVSQSFNKATNFRIDSDGYAGSIQGLRAEFSLNANFEIVELEVDMDD